MDTADHRHDTLAFWNSIANDWDIQVGRDGDANRRLNSDPVLWRLAGDVAGLTVLDAGCGTGYLSRKLHERGAQVIGADLSYAMIEIARTKTPEVDFRVESCAELRTVRDGSVDLIGSNYMLMDTPDLEGTMSAFHRFLKTGAHAVLVFSHPCFPASRARDTAGGVDVLELEEPRITKDRHHLVTESAIRKSAQKPYSVAFKLRKTARE